MIIVFPVYRNINTLFFKYYVILHVGSFIHKTGISVCTRNLLYNLSLASPRLQCAVCRHLCNIEYKL